MGYNGAGSSPIITDFTASDLLLSGIPFIPGRTIDFLFGDRFRLVKNGKFCMLDLGFSFRMGEAGSISTAYIGLPTSIPRVTGPLATSALFAMCLNSVGTASLIRLVMAPDVFDSGRNFLQMTRYTTALVTQAWPITPSARYSVQGQIFFQTES